MTKTSLRSGLILGIESSCDETAAAVVRHGALALSNVVASQMALHANYGGVVPELASREHLRNIVLVVREALARAEVSFSDLDAIAVTSGPGLAGALLVGITYAKALAYGLNKPLVAVNHLEGHIHAVLMEAASSLCAGPGENLGAPSQTVSTSEVGLHGPTTDASSRPEAAHFAAAVERPLHLPLLALVVSGGHTHLYLANHSSEEQWQYKNVGRTVDDAAGEAFDKVAKLLGLGYPGGPWVDILAPHGNPRAVPFHFGPIKPRASNSQLPTPNSQLSFDFSFSGIKTAVLRYTQTHNMAEAIEARRSAFAANPALKPSSPESLALLLQKTDRQTLDLIASFQYAVVGNLLRQTFAAAEAFGARALVISGGVAANAELRRRFTAEAARRVLPVAFPSLALSTDNAAMIATAAWPRFLAEDFAPEDLTATPQLRLG